MIGVIVNPYARGIATDPQLPARLAQIGGSYARVVQTRNLKQLNEAVRQLARDGVEIIAACGGDGTNTAVLTEMMHVFSADRLPRLAILRGGTFNTIAANLNIRGRPEDILARLVACRRREMIEPHEPHTALQINGMHGFIFASAMGARFYEAYYNHRRPGPLWASVLAARISLSALASGTFARRIFAPVTARVSAQGATLPNERWTLLVASTVMNVGLGIKISYRARERADHFHLIASGLPPAELAWQMHKTFLARPLEGALHFDTLATEAEIDFTEPQPFILDGELFRANRLTLRAGPRLQISIP